ncbi:tetratricopeptide repeat protein, partial [Sinomonas cellulolyticus]
MGESVGIDPADGRVIALCRLLHDATLGQADADTVLAGIDQLHPAGTAGPVAAAEAVLFAFLRLRCPDARPAVQEDPAGSPEEEAGDGWACLREAAEATDGSGSLKAQSRMLTGISEALASSGHVLPALNALSSAAALLEAIGDVEGSAAVHSRLGEALLAAGSASQAQQEFARAVLVFGETGTPVDAGFLFRNVMNWGRCLSIQGDHANAEQEYRLAVHVSSQASGPATDPAEAHLLLADSLRQQDRPGEAVPEYEAALGLLRQGPERAGDRMATALMGLAACHQSTGDTAMLIGSLAEALEYLDQADTARHAAVNFTLARAHSETGSTALAAAHYREAALRYTELTDAVRAALSWWQAAAALRDLDLLREALDARLAAWEALAGSGQAPDPALVQDVALGAAHSLISAGRPAEAEAPARAAIDAARATAATVAEADAHLRLGQALQAQERFPEALDCYERARRLCPTGSLALEAQDRLGMCLLALNMFHEAGQAFARAAVEAKEAGEPGTADGLHFKAGLALVHAAPGEAEQHLRAVLVSTSAQGNPARTAAVLSALAEALVQLNRHREAEETYRCAGSTYEQIGEDEESAESLNRAADTARAHGRHEDALASYQEVIARGSEAGPKNVADSYTGSGISLYKLGRYGEAEASFRHAHALYTEDDNPGAAALCLEWIA